MDVGRGLSGAFTRAVSGITEAWAEGRTLGDHLTAIKCYWNAVADLL
jgi:hypothetical protein